MAEIVSAPKEVEHDSMPRGKDAQKPERTATSSAWRTVITLCLLYAFAAIDRFLMGLVIGPIKSEFGVSDYEIALLAGPAFAFVYACMGIPMARLVDRGNRYKLLSVAAVCWALCTIGSAFAHTFLILIVLRVGLAVAEAALSPAGHSMIADLFEPEKRVRPASVFVASANAGAAATGLIGGAALLAAAYLTQVGLAPAGAEWRLTFLAAGVPSLVLAGLFIFTVTEPARKGQVQNQDQDKVSMRDVARVMLRTPRLYVSMILAIGTLATVAFAFATWTPELLQRQFGWTKAEAAFGFAVAMGVGSLFGPILTPMLSQFLERTGHPDGMLLASMGTVLAGGVAGVIATVLPSGIGYLIGFGGVTGCLGGAIANLIVSQQITAPDRMRGTMVAILLLSITIIGQGLGPTLVPLFAGPSPFASGDLAGGLMMTTLLGIVPPFALLVLARKPYREKAAQGWQNVTW